MEHHEQVCINPPPHHNKAWFLFCGIGCIQGIRTYWGGRHGGILSHVLRVVKPVLYHLNISYIPHLQELRYCIILLYHSCATSDITGIVFSDGWLAKISRSIFKLCPPSSTEDLLAEKLTMISSKVNSSTCVCAMLCNSGKTGNGVSLLTPRIHHFHRGHSQPQQIASSSYALRR